MLSVIIPALNEEKTLAQVIDRVVALPIKPQVIVVSDGSTDGTNDIVRDYDRRGIIKGVVCPTNRGKGAAIQEGLKYATQPYTVIQDADLEYAPEQFDVLLNPVRRGIARVVYGSRNLRHPEVQQNNFHYIRFWLGGKVVTLAGNLLFGTHLTDEATCYKLFPTDLLRQMNLCCRGFDFCPEVTAKSLRLGYRIHEVPIEYKPRSLDEGKKIRAWHGIQAILVLMKYRLMPHTSMFKSNGAKSAQKKICGLDTIASLDSHIANLVGYNPPLMPVDAQVFRRARKGNIRAAIEVMSDCYPQVHRIAFGLSGRDDVGRGIVKFVMRRGLRQLPTWGDENEPMRWCRHHTLLTTRRASKHKPDVTNDTLIRHAQTDNAYYAAFVRAVRTLPQQQSEAFILTHGEQWNQRALAVAMDCSQEAASNHLREATRVLSSFGGKQFATFTAQLAQTYKNLSPGDELVLTNVEWNVRRHLWPRKIWRATQLVFTAALLATIILFAWKIYPKLEF